MLPDACERRILISCERQRTMKPALCEDLRYPVLAGQESAEPANADGVGLRPLHLEV